MRILQINHDTFIPLDELNFQASRSSGPGGQHVNKASTKITLEFDVDRSPNLTDEQKAKIYQRLENRLTREGILQMHAPSSRSQHANKEEAIDRFVELLQAALKKQPPRKRTRKPRAAKLKRLQAKRHRGEIKKMRKKVDI